MIISEKNKKLFRNHSKNIKKNGEFFWEKSEKILRNLHQTQRPNSNKPDCFLFLSSIWTPSALTPSTLVLVNNSIEKSLRNFFSASFSSQRKYPKISVLTIEMPIIKDTFTNRSIICVQNLNIESIKILAGKNFSYQKWIDIWNGKFWRENIRDHHFV